MSEFDTKQPRISGYVAMNPDGSFTAVPSVGRGWPVYTSDGQPGDKVDVVVPMEGAVSQEDRAVVTDPSRLLRYCGDQPGDDWAKRVERLNGMIDVMREERGEVVA